VVCLVDRQAVRPDGGDVAEEALGLEASRVRRQAALRESLCTKFQVQRHLLVQLAGQLALAAGQPKTPPHQAGTGVVWASARATAAT
jgi:hypothetical protein